MAGGGAPTLIPFVLTGLVPYSGENRLQAGLFLYSGRECGHQMSKSKQQVKEVEKEVPEDSEAPETPEAPEASEASETAEAPETPEDSETPEVSEAPEAPEDSETPEASEAPEDSEVSKPEKAPGARWYVLRVQSNKEEQVSETLERRVKMAGPEMEKIISRVLVPSEKVTEMKGGKKRITRRRLYPGYVMVEMVLTEESQYLVKDTPGVGDFVGPTAKTPVPLTAQEVDKMLGDVKKTAEETQPKIRITFSPGDSVQIKEGPFQNFDGVVDEIIPDKGLVKVIVTIFGRSTPVELEYWQMENV